MRRPIVIHIGPSIERGYNMRGRLLIIIIFLFFFHSSLQAKGENIVIEDENQHYFSTGFTYSGDSILIKYTASNITAIGQFNITNRTIDTIFLFNENETWIHLFSATSENDIVYEVRSNNSLIYTGLRLYKATNDSWKWIMMDDTYYLFNLQWLSQQNDIFISYFKTNAIIHLNNLTIDELNRPQIGGWDPWNYYYEQEKWILETNLSEGSPYGQNFADPKDIWKVHLDTNRTEQLTGFNGHSMVNNSLPFRCVSEEYPIISPMDEKILFYAIRNERCQKLFPENESEDWIAGIYQMDMDGSNLEFVLPWNETPENLFISPIGDRIGFSLNGSIYLFDYEMTRHLPDLFIYDILTDDYIPEGKYVQISSTIKNRGNNPSEPTNAVISVDSVPVGTIQIPGLGSLETVTVQTGWVVTRGDHTISVEVDDPDNNLEWDENNNIRSDHIDVQPLLKLTNVSLSSDNITAGDLLNISGRLENNGTLRSPFVDLSLFIDGVSMNEQYLQSVEAGGNQQFLFNWTAVEGVHDISIQASYEDVGIWNNVSIVAHHPNHSPIIGPVGNQLAIAGKGYHLQLNGSDPDPWDAVNLTYKLDKGPAGLSLDPFTGRISWTPTEADIGDHTVVITLTDGKASVNTTYVITVEEAPGTAEVTALNTLLPIILIFVALIVYGVVITRKLMGERDRPGKRRK